MIRYYLHGISTAFKCVDNFFELMLFRQGMKDECIVKTKTLGNFHLKDIPMKISMINLILNFQTKVLENNSSDEEIEIFKDFINSLNENKEYVVLNGVKFENNSEILVLFEYFSEMGNAPFESIENKVVIDIGANIADTSLLFAHEGCEVYSFEPVPPIYEIGQRNIKLNPEIENKVHLFNKAVSDSEGTIEIKFGGEGTSLSSSAYSSQGKSYQIEAISLNQIISKLDAQGIVPNLLHMDCEGSEYDIVPNSDFTIFEEVVIEHHQKMVGKSYNIIIDVLLEQGFEIRDKISWGNSSFEELGIIHAVNKKFQC